MTITEILNAIKTAVYGREVRTAIHDGIQQCYNDTQAFAQTASAAITSAEGAATRANTAAGSAETQASAASTAASRANTAAAAAEAAVDQINNSDGIISVNGHQGVVNLTASDVGALPSGTTAADIGGIASVNGVEPDEDGSLTITGADIPGTQMDLLWEGEQEVKSGNVFNLGVDARNYKALIAVFTRSTNMRGHMLFTPYDLVGTALIGSTYYTERVYTASIVLNWSSDYKSFTPTVGGSYYNGSTSVTYEKNIMKIYGMR